MTHYENTDQITKKKDYTYKQPKYDKSTTDPTYYEPAATRIANMKKASGVILEGIYDFYSKDDVSKFNEKNFQKHISNASPDIRYVKGLTQEEISQVTTSYANQVDESLDKKQSKENAKNERIAEQIQTAEAINKASEKSIE